MTGDSMREFDALQFTDGYGDVWTVRPSDAEPGDVDVRVDTEVGPVGLVIPARDVAQLTARLMAAKFAAERRAARVANAKAAAPIAGEPRRADSFAVGDRVEWSHDGEDFAGIVTMASDGSSVGIRDSDGDLWGFHPTDTDLRPAAAPAPPTTDGTCNHGGEDDDNDTGEFPGATAHVGEVS